MTGPTPLAAVLAAEAAAYQWLDPHRARTARDPHLAATIARLWEEREAERARADAAELTVRRLRVAIDALSAELRRYNQSADAEDGQ